MSSDFGIKWSAASNLTFSRMPIDVQASLLKQLPQLVSKYADLYQRKPSDSVCVGTITHMEVPEWSMWLRMDSEYSEDQTGPMLLINKLEELSKAEVDASVAAAHQLPGRINPTGRD